MADNNVPSSWSDERVERLKALWADGLSATQIACDLGGISRNGCIGKVHRLGLPTRMKPNRKPYVRKSRAAEQRARRLADRVKRAEAAAPAVAPVARGSHSGFITRVNQGLPIKGNAPAAVRDENLSTQLSTPADDLAIPQAQRCTILELTNETCRFPIGEGAALFFCGGPANNAAGQVYCDSHSVRCFNGPPRKPRNEYRGTKHG